jgi:hypothetical protein
MRYIPAMTYPEIVESCEHWIVSNPNGGLMREIQFAIGSDALLMGKMPPSESDILASITQAPGAKGLQRTDALVRVIPVQSDDFMFQRITCEDAAKIRRVLEEVEKLTHGARLAGEEVAPLIEALRIQA